MRPGLWLALIGFLAQLLAPVFPEKLAAPLAARFGDAELAQFEMFVGFGGSICHRAEPGPASSPESPDKGKSDEGFTCLLCCALQQSAGLMPGPAAFLSSVASADHAAIRLAGSFRPRGRYISAKPRAPPARATA
jgi:hypothetical protein